MYLAPIPFVLQDVAMDSSMMFNMYTVCNLLHNSCLAYYKFFNDMITLKAIINRE